jgi:outer membrane protein
VNPVKTKLYAIILCFIISNSFSSIAFSAFGFSSSSSSSSQKIGYVDVKEVLLKSRWGNEIQIEVTRQKNTLRSELAQISRRYEEMRDQFEKKKAALNAKSRRIQAADLQMLEQKGKELLQKSRSKYAELQQKLMTPLLAKLMEVVNQIAKKDHYDHIMDKAALIYAEGKDDLTSRVLTELNNATPSNPLGAIRLD